MLRIVWAGKRAGIDFPPKKRSAGIRELIFRACRVLLKQSRFFKVCTGLRDVLASVVIDVSGKTGGVNDDVVVLEELQNAVMDWGHPVHALNHLTKRFFHCHLVSIGLQSNLWEIPENLSWISGKAISSKPFIEVISHELGSQVRTNGEKPDPDYGGSPARGTRQNA